jgi:hypothetical protein
MRVVLKAFRGFVSKEVAELDQPLKELDLGEIPGGPHFLLGDPVKMYLLGIACDSEEVQGLIISGEDCTVAVFADDAIQYAAYLSNDREHVEAKKQEILHG